MANPEVDNYVPNPVARLADKLADITKAIEYLRSVGWVDIIPGKREPYIIHEPLETVMTAEGFKMVPTPAFKVYSPANIGGAPYAVKTYRLSASLPAEDDPKKVLVSPLLAKYAIEFAKKQRLTHIYGVTIARTPVHGLLPPDLLVTLRGRRVELPAAQETGECPRCQGTGRVKIELKSAPPGNYPYVVNGRMYYAPSNIITSQTLYDELFERTGLNKHSVTLWTVDESTQEVILVPPCGRSIDLMKDCNHFISGHNAQGRPHIAEFSTNARIAACDKSPADKANKHVWIEMGGWYSCSKCGLPAGAPTQEENCRGRSSSQHTIYEANNGED